MADVPPPYATTLDDPYQRFLASLTEHGLELGLRTSEDLVRHFSPRVIMNALSSDAALRATLLEQTIGVKRKVGLRKSPASAGEDLQIALDEGVTSAPAIVEIFTADERARHLDPRDLWAYITEAEFWRIEKDDERWAEARDHVAFFLESALANGLLTPRSIVTGVTLARLVHHLPEEVLESLFASAIAQARIHEPFSEDEMMFVATAAVLAEHVPLADLWDSVIAGLAPGASKTPPKKSSAPPARARTAPLAPTSTIAAIEAPAPTAAPIEEPVDTDEPVEEEEPASSHAMSPPRMPGRGPTIPLPPGKPVPRPPGLSRPGMAMPEADGGKRASRRPR